MSGYADQFRVELHSVAQLSKEERDDLCPDPSETFLRVIHKNKTILLEGDNMPSEDAYFSRDLKWIPKIIKDAYRLGFEDGQKTQSDDNNNNNKKQQKKF